MAQNVLRTVGEDGQPTEDEADTGFARDARGLLGHLNSALATSADEDALAADNVPPVITQAPPQAPSFGRAVARQAEQIQFLVEQIDRLDRDTQVVELREIVRALYGTLGDVALRMKENSSEVATKIELLAGAVTVIGSAPDVDKPHDITTILDSAKATADRLALFEHFSSDASTAISTLKDNASRNQTTVRDLVEKLAASNERGESNRKEIADLCQQVESTSGSLARRLIKVDEVIETDRKETARLQQRLDATDASLTKGLSKVGDAIEAERNDITQLQRRIDATDGSLVKGLANVGDALEAERNDIAQLQRRIAATDQTVAQELASFGGQTSALHDGLARIQECVVSIETRLNSLESKNQALTQEKEQTAARLHAMEQTLATMNQRQNALSAWHDRVAHVLLTKPELPTV